MHGSPPSRSRRGARALRTALITATLAGAAVTVAPGAALAVAPPPAPVQLTIGDRAQPLDVSGPPQFGWQDATSAGADVQSAYEIRVDRASDGVQVWDSGKTISGDQSYVPYGGPTLADGASYTWEVRRWDSSDQASPWSAAGNFDVALADADWSGASWIRRATPSGNDSTDDYTLARKVFTVSSSPVTRARAYTSGMAQYELHLNGSKVMRGNSFDYPGEGQYTATDITSDVTAGSPLAVGMMEHYWTCTCQGRANGPASNTTLSASAAAGDTTLKVASVGVFDVGDTVEIGATGATERVTVTAIGTAGAAGTGITVSPGLTTARASAVAVRDLDGPSGMLAKIVVDHADGTRQTFVSDGSWKVAKNPAYTNTTVVRRNGDSGDVAEEYDARQELTGWDTASYDDRAWESPIDIGTHPRPVNPLRDTFSHLDPSLTDLKYQTLHPVSVKTLADGSVVADFGRVVTAVPQIKIGEGVSGRTLSSVTSYRLNNTTLAAAATAGDTAIHVTSVSNFQVGDTVTVDAPAANRGPGDPEKHTITAVGTAGAAGTGITIDGPLDRAHDNGAWIEGSRAGTATGDTQGSVLKWSYTEKDGAQTAQAYTYWGWRYLQISAPGEPLTASDIGAVEQSDHTPDDRKSTFTSDNATLNGVFDLTQRSGELSTQETYLDTPTREKGGFLGDGIDISWANMTSIGERGATVRALREAIESGVHSWKAGSSGYCTSVQVPCSYGSLGTPGRLNSVYPNGDNMRDIPDYTEALPDWVWRYYLLTGDKQTLAMAYPTMQAVSAYIHGAQPTTGDAAGLVYQLPGGTSSYLGGIIDWPAPMRYGYTFTGNGARTIHSAEGVGAYSATGNAAAALGKTDDAEQYANWKSSLADAINAKLVLPNGLYSDGLSTDAGNPIIENSAQHAQTYPIYFGIAPKSSYAALSSNIVSQGMHQGPMTWHVLLKALADADQDDQVVHLLTDAKADGPARILAENGTFMWEQWSPGCSVSPCADKTQQSNESQSHGWGSTGVVDMVETLLGVQVTAPGASQVTIAPPSLGTADLHHVQGSTWTERGTVSVDWTRSGGDLSLAVDVPGNVKATVRIPDADGATYAATGEGQATFVGLQDGDAVFTVGSGRTTFAVAPTGGDDGGTPTPTPTPTPAPVSPPTLIPAPTVLPAPTPNPIPAPGKPALDRTAPRLSTVKRSSALRVRRSVSIRVNVSEAGKLKMSLVRLSSSGRHVKATSPTAAKLRSGTQTIKVNTSRLKVGRYRLAVTATDAAGNRSGTHTVAFTVVGH